MYIYTFVHICTYISIGIHVCVPQTLNLTPYTLGVRTGNGGDSADDGAAEAAAGPGRGRDEAALRGEFPLL